MKMLGFEEMVFFSQIIITLLGFAAKYLKKFPGSLRKFPGLVGMGIGMRGI